jgi:hypothetical protein
LSPGKLFPKRQHFRVVGDPDADGDENPHERLAGDESGRGQHAVLLELLVILSGAVPRVPERSELGHDAAGKDGRRHVERQINADRDGEHRRAPA